MKFKYLVYIVFSLFIIIIFNSCKDNKKQETDKNENNIPQEIDLVNKGKEIFYKNSEITGLKCADCHFDGSNAQNSNTKYFSDIIGASDRNSTYNGMFKGEDVKKNAGGSSICRKNYLKADKDFSDEEINSLNAYFQSLSNSNNRKEVLYTTIAIPKPDKSKLKEDQSAIAGLKGDISHGEIIYNETCSFCHSKNSNVKNVPSLFDNFEGNFKSITYHIRIGSKHMPFYSYEKLSNQDIADISAFILKKK